MVVYQVQPTGKNKGYLLMEGKVVTGAIIPVDGGFTAYSGV